MSTSLVDRGGLWSMLLGRRSDESRPLYVKRGRLAQQLLEAGWTPPLPTDKAVDRLVTNMELAWADKRLTTQRAMMLEEEGFADAGADLSPPELETLNLV